MIFNAICASGHTGIETPSFTVVAAMLHDYKYLLCLALITILPFFNFLLRVFLSPSLSHNGRQEGN
jgi:hypothetical protein